MQHSRQCTKPPDRARWSEGCSNNGPQPGCPQHGHPQLFTVKSCQHHTTSIPCTCAFKPTKHCQRPSAAGGRHLPHQHTMPPDKLVCETHANTWLQQPYSGLTQACIRCNTTISQSVTVAPSITCLVIVMRETCSRKLNRLWCGLNHKCSQQPAMLHHQASTVSLNRQTQLPKPNKKSHTTWGYCTCSHLGSCIPCRHDTQICKPASPTLHTCSRH